MDFNIRDMVTIWNAIKKFDMESFKRVFGLAMNKNEIKRELNDYSLRCANNPRNNIPSSDFAVLIGFTGILPIPNTLDEKYEIDIEDKELLKEMYKLSKKNEKTLKHNEIQTILHKDVDVTTIHNLNEIDVLPLKYSHVSAIRETITSLDRYKNKSPQVITAGTLLVCPENRQIVVQHRQNTETHPDHYHTFGGAYRKTEFFEEIDFNIANDRNSLKFTLVREVFEETNIVLNKDNIYDEYCVVRQNDDGYIQFYSICAKITSADMDNLQGIDEGSVVIIDFDDLERELMEQNWVPSGKMHILIWLAFGAPYTSFFERFGGLSAKKLYKKVIQNS